MGIFLRQIKISTLTFISDLDVPISMTKQALHSSLTFDGRVVVITGSGTGIGQAIAKKFAERGASIIIMGRRREPLDATTEILNEIIKNADTICALVTIDGAWLHTIQRKLFIPPAEVAHIFRQMPADENFQWLD